MFAWQCHTFGSIFDASSTRTAVGLYVPCANMSQEIGETRSMRRIRKLLFFKKKRANTAHRVSHNSLERPTEEAVMLIDKDDRACFLLFLFFFNSTTTSTANNHTHRNT